MTENRVLVGWGFLIGAMIGTLTGAYIAVHTQSGTSILDAVFWSAIIPTGMAIGMVIGTLIDIEIWRRQ